VQDFAGDLGRSRTSRPSRFVHEGGPETVFLPARRPASFMSVMSGGGGVALLSAFRQFR